MNRIGRSLFLVWTAAAFVTSSQALANDSFTAANGTILRAPEIASLDCTQMNALLQEYSASGYRGPEMLGYDDPDRPIYDYEHQLGTEYYEACQAGTSLFMDSGSVFGRGFTD